MARVRTIPSALTIAGSDSGGGAGIQADLKTFAALGVYGTCVLTAITAQNTVAVTAVHEVPKEIILAQIEAVVSDIGVDAVKTGMLSSNAIIGCVSEAIATNSLLGPVVVDPVMVAKSGDSLLRKEAVGALREKLLPLATLVTPNIPEAEALTGITIESDDDVRRAAQEIIDMGPASVVVKGGHRAGPATDLYYDGRSFREFTAPPPGDCQHPRYRLHLRFSGGGESGQGTGNGGCRCPGQEICDRGHSWFLHHRPGPWPPKSLLPILGLSDMTSTIAEQKKERAQ